MAVERDRPTRTEEAIELLVEELRKVKSPTGKRLAWNEVRRQVERRVFAAQEKRAA